jgi:hypothetical protein
MIQYGPGGGCGYPKQLVSFLKEELMLYLNPIGGFVRVTEFCRVPLFAAALWLSSPTAHAQEMITSGPAGSCATSLMGQQGRSSGYVEGYNGNLIGRSLDRFFFKIGSLFHKKQSIAEAKLEVPEALKTNPNAISMLELAKSGVLINQLDRRLQRLGLVLPNGGLCGPTSLTNIILALIIPNGFAVENKLNELVGQIVQDFVNAYTNTFPRLPAEGSAISNLGNALIAVLADGRRGTNLQLLRKVAMELGPLGFTSEPVEVTEPGLIEAFKQPGLAQVGARLGPLGPGFSQHLRHAIAIAGIDPSLKLIYFSDPNDEGRIGESPYQVEADGRLSFKLLFNYGARTSPTAYLEDGFIYRFSYPAGAM